MPSMVVRQPDGLLAGFNSVVDDFSFYGATREEAIKFFVEHGELSWQDAEAKVEGGLLDQDPWTPNGPPGSGHDRWDDCLGTIVFRHGEARLRERLALLGFPFYPVDEIIANRADPERDFDGNITPSPTL